MDDQRFDAVTRLAANAPDRRNMLKLAGAAAVGTAGFLARADDAEAKLLAVTITNVINNLQTQVLVRAKTTRGVRAQAAKICSAVEQMSSDLDGNGSSFDFTCTY